MEHDGDEGRAPAAGLSSVEEAMLDFMHRQFPYPGARDQAIDEEFGMKAVEFFHRLNTLLDQQAALAYDPVLVYRLRSLRHSPLDAQYSGF